MLHKLLQRKKTLPKIVGGFEKTLNDLGELQKHNNAQIDTHSERLNESRVKIAEAQAENEKAGAVAHNIRKLLNS